MVPRALIGGPCSKGCLSSRKSCIYQLIEERGGCINREQQITINSVELFNDALLSERNDACSKNPSSFKLRGPEMLAALRA